jgi:hypothetical protein
MTDGMKHHDFGPGKAHAHNKNLKKLYNVELCVKVDKKESRYISRQE